MVARRSSRPERPDGARVWMEKNFYVLHVVGMGLPAWTFGGDDRGEYLYHDKSWCCPSVAHLRHLRRRTFVSAARRVAHHIQRIGHWRSDHNKY